jgi:hypothetical protein
MSEVTVTDDLPRQDFDAVSAPTEKRIVLPVEEVAAPIVLRTEDLARVAGGLTRKGQNEYEGQHR